MDIGYSILENKKINKYSPAKKYPIFQNMITKKTNYIFQNTRQLES